jgi:hypothetical protein
VRFGSLEKRPRWRIFDFLISVAHLCVFPKLSVGRLTKIARASLVSVAWRFFLVQTRSFIVSTSLQFCRSPIHPFRFKDFEWSVLNWTCLSLQI